MANDSDIVNLTIADWRELGFYYDRVDDERVWRLIGSREGLLSLPRLLREYIAHPAKAEMRYHEHYGPYHYLTVTTWEEPLIDSRGIAGTLDDLQRLADLLEVVVRSTDDGEIVLFGSSYSPYAESDYFLRIEVMRDGFDPASVDPLLPG